MTLNLVSMRLDSPCLLWQAGWGLGPGVSLWEGHITHKGEGEVGGAGGAGCIHTISKDTQRKAHSWLLLSEKDTENNVCLISNAWLTVFHKTLQSCHQSSPFAVTHVHIASAAPSLVVCVPWRAARVQQVASSALTSSVTTPGQHDQDTSEMNCTGIIGSRVVMLPQCLCVTVSLY